MVERVAPADVESIAMLKHVGIAGVRIDLGPLVARCGFMMQKHRFTVANNFISEIAYTKAKIDVP
ncbi:MAG: hypothetical protein VW546_03665, partial [Gammaproteobacteria bacterium]